MYHVCHKCKLPRARDPGDVDLGGCICMGRTWFPYEEQPRTETEARELATQQYHEWLALYERQKRDRSAYERLAREYGKAVKLS